MNFQKYNSLENAYRQKFTDACHSLGIQDWVATVKVHGANFGFMCNPQGDVTPFKRSSTISKNPETGNYDFYGCNNIVAEYTPKVKRLAEIVGKPVQAYGELYGQGVQKEINYGGKKFIMFDILTDDGWLEWDEVVRLGKQADIPTAPELARGKLEDMLAISPEFSCPLSPTGDASEGLVIKPLTDGTTKLSTGSRPIIKNKSKAFSEKKQAKKPRSKTGIPDHLKPLLHHFLAYVNKNRLNNVLSKIDPSTITQKDFGRVLGLFVQDAKSEFERDEHEIDKDDWKVVSGAIQKEAGQVLREDWLNILDAD